MVDLVTADLNVFALRIYTSPEEVKSHSGSGYGVLIQAKNAGSLKVLKRFRSSELTIASATEESVIRAVLENKKIHAFTNIETSYGREHTHYRRSNLNQVLAKIAAETGKTYIIDFARILNTPAGQKRALLLGRIMQNIRILQKYRVPIAIASFASTELELRSKDNLNAFARVLGVTKPIDEFKQTPYEPVRILD